MRRALLLAVALLTLLPAAAGAHPLGNFSVNHLAQVSVSRDDVRVRYVLDQAEIPTFQERGLPDAAVLARKRAEVARGLLLRVDGRPVPLALAPGGTLAHRPGQAGLETTRVTLELRAAVRGPRQVVLTDRTFPGRVGWKAIVPVPGRGTAVRSSVPAADPTHGLTAYPRALLSSPADVRTATLRVTPGRGTVTAPDGHAAATAAAHDGFAGLLDRPGTGAGVLLLLVLAAFGWGALHALSPGHGKAMVAAYLVGTRGRPRDALALGLITTVTHTAGVFALGLVTLALSAYVVPEDLYPWLTFVSGLMVLVVGAGVLRARLRDRGHRHHHRHHHGPGGGHTHHHGPPARGVSRRGLLAMGASAGLVPCPTALVVLLGAIAQHRVGAGLLLIVAFSAGLAATLSTLGVLVVRAARLPRRVPLAGALPAVSAAAIVGVGLVLTVRAIPGLG